MTGPVPARQSLVAAGCLDTVLVAGACLWLWSRGRLELLQTEAIGRHGAFAAAGAGLATAFAGTAVFLLVRRRLGFVRDAETHVRALFAPIGEASTLAIVVAGALAEEVFFRLAVQDAFGLVGSVAAYAFVGTCTVGWTWLPFVLLHATALGLLMHYGFGLLATTTANAILNHLCLRRILQP